MYLSDVFRRLSTGELSSYFIGSGVKGTIVQEDWAEIIDHINLALTALHTRLPLKEEWVTIQEYSHINMYYLKSEYAESNKDSTQKIKYIKDSPHEPFRDNVIRIESITDEYYQSISINDSGACKVVYTPNHNTIQVPNPYEERALFISYRADHPRIDVNLTDPAKVYIDIPVYLEEALLSYVAHRFLNGKNSEITKALSSAEFGKYMAICNNVEQSDLLNQSHGGVNQHPWIQGWI